MAEGSSGTKKIERLKAGDKSRTAMHADVMNEIIDTINALCNLKIIANSGTVGEMFVSDSNAVIVLSTTDECPS